MSKSRASSLRLLVADPDPARRGRLLTQFRGAGAIEAASLAEAFDLAESQEPDAIIMAVELSGDPGLPMFLHLVDALSASFVMYGDERANRLPLRFRKSVDFAAYGGGDGLERILGRVEVGAKGRIAAAPEGSMPGLVVVGASTGGVSALETVLTGFPADCPPTLVVQHIRTGFIDGMIARLDARCRPRVLAARDGMPVTAGHIYVAADSDTHLSLQGGAALRCRLRADPPRHGHRPSVDVLFESAAPYGRRVAAALLTGMGADGASGMGRIKAAGGMTIAQNEATCVVYGMPRVAVEIGAACSVLPLERIAGALIGSGDPSSAPCMTDRPSRTEVVR
ncbi:chemotaxis protein CheB [Roseibacterium sp. SDUM158017]|uniref:chemotaxis protein CheB n=1 Tax=Roseicyclus salinarum TaxID=3036773 RepID=UPI00241504B0|nr:chemotaxis protein CheB [Roseibacterium sp. SDUM158017]MDG4649237.1 chemotaxis protein CheB [Roseibacterium sp. SDUM158017]